ncbi:MAG: protein kinase [Anaerolineae bacterium]|nr:protein kinase [Anaerolineae bacterium]
MENLPRQIGRYEIIELIGQGAMGKVFKAKDPNIGRVVAIKVIRPELLSQSETFLTRFRRETQAAGRLSHPNIVIVYDAEMEGALSYMVMEYLEGHALSDIIGQGLSPEQVIEFGMQICDALEYAHSQGLVHRDIKPENIMILSNGRVKITDFGLARLTTSPHLTHSGMITGTPSYMSPEQISGQDLDGRTDIFAVGCALYEMLTGHRPFPGDSIGTVLYRIMNEDPEPSPKLDNVAPQLIKSIIMRALEKKPTDRYQTCADLIVDLKQCKQIGEAAGMISPLPAPETTQTATITAPGILPAVSPFTYGNPITDPERFYGRHREIEQIFSRLRNPAFESSSIVGERRVGKTSLLRVIAHPDVVRAQGLDPETYIFVYNDLLMVSETTTPLQLWIRLLRTIRRQIQEPNPELNDIVAELRSSDVIDNYLLADFFDLLSDSGIHVVLLLDEFEKITYNTNFGPDFYGGLRSLAIHHDLALITSSRLELVNLCHSDQVRTSPFFNIFANINLRGLETEEVRTLITLPLQGMGFTFTEQEQLALIAYTGCHPFFSQVAAHFLWHAYREGIPSEQRLTHMQHNACIEAEPHFADYWQHSTESERIALTALALKGVINRDIDQYKDDLAHQSFGRMESTAGLLRKRALILSPNGQDKLFSPAFEDWIMGEIFSLVGTADQSFQEWLSKQTQPFADPVREILPRVKMEHRLWLGQWLSANESSALLQAIQHFLGHS